MDRNMDDGVEDFQCQICLEVAYKPVVQACGHIFCFWCLHHAMDFSDTSHCPLCRSPYQHLPRVCELLHYLLLKAFPKEYKERAEEVLEWEKIRGTFSPELGTLDLNGQESEVLEVDKENHNFSSQFGTLDINRQEGKVLELDEQKCNQSSQLGILDSNGHANEVLNSEKQKISPSQPGSLDLNAQASAEASISERKLKVSDALCAHCKELIYRPTVLNCGHAYCESCVNFNIFQGTTLKCQVCQSLHPEKSWAVCLELHHFLQNMFTVEYAEREKSMLVHSKQPKEELPTDETAETSCQKDMVIHVGVGCDNCGLYPIMGKRYKCKDCSESMGFDLCETCYQSQRGSRIFGRFNQHHTAEHQFEELAGEVSEGDIFLDGDTGQNPGQRLYVFTV